MTTLPRLSIGAVSRAAGIPVPTIRTWERRYGFPAPERRASGHRQYPSDIIEHLRLLALALNSGHRAAQVVPLPLEDLKALMILSATASRDAPLARTGGAAAQAMLEELLGTALAFRIGGLQAALEAKREELGAIDFVDECLGPFLVALGAAWAEGRLPVANEHAASECIRLVLSRLWLPGRDRLVDDVAVHATLPGENHDIGLHMSAVAFAEAGWRIVFLGANTPVLDVAIAARESGARAVALSISAASDPSETVRALRSLRRVLPEDVSIAVGGAGAPTDVPMVEHFSAVRALHEWAKSIRSS